MFCSKSWYVRLVERIRVHDSELKLSRNLSESTFIRKFFFCFFLRLIFYLVFFTSQCNKMHTHRMLHFAIVLVKFVTCQQNILVTRISGRGSMLCIGSCAQALMQMKMAFEIFINKKKIEWNERDKKSKKNNIGSNNSTAWLFDVDPCRVNAIECDFIIISKFLTSNVSQCICTRTNTHR